MRLNRYTSRDFGQWGQTVSRSVPFAISARVRSFFIKSRYGSATLPRVGSVWTTRTTGVNCCDEDMEEHIEGLLSSAALGPRPG